MITSFKYLMLYCIDNILIDCKDEPRTETDAYGKGCDWYLENAGGVWVNRHKCGQQDDIDFNALDMCCACKCNSTSPFIYS